MKYIIMYDICDSQRRNEVAWILEEYGKRIQYSVFFCDLTKKEFEHVRTALVAVIDMEEDSLRCYPVCSDCWEKIYTLGYVPEEKNYQIL